MTDKYDKILESITKKLGECSKLESEFNDLKKQVEDLQQAEKQPEIDIEEQVFNCMKPQYISILFSTITNISYNRFHEVFTLGTVFCEKEYKQVWFLAIMQAVHILIEGNERKFDKDRNNYTFYKDLNYMSNGLSVFTSHQYNPDFFYFSTPEDRDRAKEILSTFFGVDLLNWWFE